MGSRMYFYSKSGSSWAFSDAPKAVPPTNKGYRRALVSKLLKMSVERAKRVCENPTDHHTCAIAWDLVEDYETTLRRMKQQYDDPMETYCQEDPNALECRIYDM